MMALVCQPCLAFPEHCVSQDDLIDTLRAHYASKAVPGLEAALRLVRNTTVQQRHFALPKDRLFVHPGVATRSDGYVFSASRLALSAIQRALDNAHLTGESIHLLVLVSCTAPVALLPGLDAYLLNAFQFHPHVRRLPISQMGCHGGASGLAQAYDYLLAHPTHNALVCCVELCSHNEQPDDLSPSSFVSRGLFGDAAGAVVVRGDNRGSGFAIEATRQHLVPDTIGVMRYQSDERGNHFETLPYVVAGLKRGFPAIHAFLAEHGYQAPDDLGFLLSHTGGPRVMDAVVRELGIEEKMIAASRESLREVGNISSVAVLDVLARSFQQYRPAPDELGLMLSFGPGETIEMLLGRWKA
jgi:predicted naringenin-chalcone synthase